jgi:hypothetical protein
MTEEEKKNYSYLGDGVYSFFDGYGIWLRTGNHEETLCDEEIYLEPEVLKNLNLFDQRVRTKKEEKE